MKPKYYQPQSKTLKENIYATVLVFMLGLFTNDDHKLQKYVPKKDHLLKKKATLRGSEQSLESMNF